MVLIPALFIICVLESSPTGSSTQSPGVKRSNTINPSEDDAENQTHGQKSKTEHEVRNVSALEPPPVKHYIGSVTQHKKYNQI